MWSVWNTHVTMSLWCDQCETHMLRWVYDVISVKHTRYDESMMWSVWNTHVTMSLWWDQWNTHVTMSLWCDQCETHTLRWVYDVISVNTHACAVGTTHLQVWKTKGWPCKSRLGQKGGFTHVHRRFFWEAKKSQLPLSGNPENRCHRWACLHPSSSCWSGVPTLKAVSISPLAARRPQAIKEPNLGSSPLHLLPPAHTHQCLWDQSPRAPLELRTCPECKLYSQGRLTCEQWGGTLLCSMGNSDCAFPKVIGKSVVLWLLFPTVVLLLFFINTKCYYFQPGEFIQALLGWGLDQTSVHSHTSSPTGPTLLNQE